MKRIIFLFLIVILLVCQVSGQEIFSKSSKDKADVKKAIDSYVDFLRSKKQLSQELSLLTNLNKGQTISDKEFKKICKVIYEADLIDPIEISRLQWQDRLRAEKESNGNQEKFSDLFGATLGVIENNLIRYIQPKLPAYVFGVLVNDLIIRGKVLSIEEFINKTNNYNIKGKKLTILIEDFLKTNINYSPGDTIEVIYYDYWIDNMKQWQEGAEYVFNITLNLDTKSESISNLLITGIENTDGFFPIINDTVIDETGFYKFSFPVTWSEFKEKLNKELNSIID